MFAKRLIKLAKTENRFVDVEFVIDAFVENKFVVVALLITPVVNVALPAFISAVFSTAAFANNFVLVASVNVASVPYKFMITDVPVAEKFVVDAFATCKFVPVAFLNVRFSTNKFKKFAQAAKKYVVVASVIDALSENKSVEVDCVIEA